MLKVGQAAEELMRHAPNPFILQIGAMDGKSYDPMYASITKHRWRGLLVEPIKDLFDKLVANYAGYEGLAFENCAIGLESGHLNMYRLPLDFARDGREAWAGTSSMYNDRNALGGKAIPADEYERIRQNIVTEQVRSMTMKDLLEKHQVSKVDVLQIDTEGADYEVLKQFDFNAYHPMIVHVEHYNLPPDECKELLYLLLQEKYELHVDNKDVLAISIP